MRQGIVLFAVLLLVLGISSCDQTSSKVKVIAHPWVGYEPVFMAYREGWIDKQKVEIIESANASESIAALMEGKVDAAMLTLDEAISIKQDGLDIKVILVVDESAGADAVVSKSDITSIADLKSKRIGLEKSTVGAIMLENVLRLAGLSKADVTLVDVTADKHEDAWVMGKVDALISYEPVISRLLQRGGKRLFDSSKIPGAILDVLVVRSDASRKHSRALENLVMGHFRGVDHIHKYHKDSAYRVAEHMRLNVNDVLLAFRGLEFPIATVQPAYLAENGKVVQAAVGILKAHHGKQDNTEKVIEDLVDARFLP